MEHAKHLIWEQQLAYLDKGVVTSCVAADEVMIQTL
jgi:hypothetical protein